MMQAQTSRIPEPDVAVEAAAPGKVILFGEHAINRGQPALSASVGLRAHCRISLQRNNGLFLSKWNYSSKPFPRNLFLH